MHDLLSIAPYGIAIALGSQFKLSRTESGFTVTADPQFLKLVKSLTRKAIAQVKRPEVKQAAVIQIDRIKSAIKPAA